VTTKTSKDPNLPLPGKFLIGQIVLIRGGELDGTVGTIVALPSHNAVHLQIKNKDGVGFGADGMTTVRPEYLEAMPASRDKWKTGDLVCVIHDDTWRDAIVLETARMNDMDAALVDYGKGIGGWVGFDMLRERLVIPSFETPEAADEWSDAVRRNLRDVLNARDAPKTAR
jgi:hypothetical protein